MAIANELSIDENATAVRMAQAIFGAGVTERCLAGRQTTKCVEREGVDEIRTIFSELNPEIGDGYRPASRQTSRHFEAHVLLSQEEAA